MGSSEVAYSLGVRSSPLGTSCIIISSILPMCGSSPSGFVASRTCCKFVTFSPSSRSWMMWLRRPPSWPSGTCSKKLPLRSSRGRPRRSCRALPRSLRHPLPPRADFPTKTSRARVLVARRWREVRSGSRPRTIPTSSRESATARRRSAGRESALPRGPGDRRTGRTRRRRRARGESGCP